MKECPFINNPFSGLLNLFRKRSSITPLFLAFVLIFPPGLSLSQFTPPPPDPTLNSPAHSTYVEFLDYSGCAGQAPASVNSAYEQQVVELVNAERTSRGLSPLKRVALLDQASRYQAMDMQQDSYFDHDTYDWINGILSLTCSMATRISSYYPNWNMIGENIALGYSSPQNVMAGWMGSEGHQQNILRPDFWEIGVGYYTGNYWVQDFGRRNNVYPLIINNEAAETDNRVVSLYIYNRSITYGWSEMRLRNDALSWTEWMPYQTSWTWNLPNSVGEHTVTVELRRGTITASSNDSIYLNRIDGGELGNLPQNLTFTYSIADQRFIPSEFDLVPLDIEGNTTLNWAIATSGNWFNVTPDNGISPNGFSVIPGGSYSAPGSAYTGSVTVAVTSPDGVVGSPHQISLTLNIIAGSHEVYLPLLTRTP